MSLTPIRALIESSFGISATPGMPILTGSVLPSARRAAMNVRIATASKQSWVVM